MRNYEDEYNQALEPGDLGTTSAAPAAASASTRAPANWQPGYDTLKKQMEAIQSKADVYKRRSPLEASTHIDNIAKSLAKDYGITNLSDIGVRYETRPAYVSGSDESATVIPEEQLPIYYNKNNPNQVIPGYKFASEGAGKGFSNYNLQPVSDGKGGTIVVPVQEYSKSGLGAFVEDLGPILPVINIALMGAGVPPLAVGAGNLALQGAAGNIGDFNDALRIAAPFALTAGMQGLDVVGPSTASTLAGRIAENYSGLTGIGADVLGGGLSGAVKAGLTGGDVLANTLTGAVAPGLSAAGKYVTSGIKDAFGGLTGLDTDINPNDFDANALKTFDTTDPHALFGNLTDDELNDLYGSTAPTTTGALTRGLTLGAGDTMNTAAGGTGANLTLSNTAGTNSVVTPSVTSSTGMPSQDELDNMDSVIHNGKTYYYTGGNSLDVFGGGPNAAVYVQDANGNLSIAGTDEFQDALIGSGAGIFNTGADTSGLSKVTVTGKNEVPSGRLTLSDAGTTPAVDPNLLSTLTSLSQINPLGSSQVAALTSGDLKALSTAQVATIDTKTTGALNTSQIAATNTSQIAAINTSQVNALTSSQIASLVLTTGTGLLLSDIVGGGTKATTGQTALTSTQAPAASTNITALNTSQVGAVTTGQTALSTSQVGAMSTMDALGLQGIADPTLRYWNQTGRAGTGGQGGVRFFDWTTNPVPVMGGSNIAAAQALSSVPMLTEAQIAALHPTPKQYFNAATNRYYTDPTGQWTPPAGWTQKTFKDGGEVETQNFGIGGGVLGDFMDYGVGVDLTPGDFMDYGTGVDLSNLLGGTLSDADVNQYLRDLPSDNASYGDIDRTASYQQDIKDAANASGSLSGVAKTVVDKLAGLGAKLTESALKSIENNPGAWLAALAGAGLGYAASKNNTVSPMGLQSLGLSQQQVYNTLKGGNYVGKAMGGEIPGYGAGGGLHYLKSAEDGMADKIPATIDNKQPARLSGGEFIIPADVVSHLGNGNSEAGAKHLYEMMDRIRQARTGTSKQSKQINPAKFTPK